MLYAIPPGAYDPLRNLHGGMLALSISFNIQIVVTATKWDTFYLIAVLFCVLHEKSMPKELPSASALVFKRQSQISSWKHNLKMFRTVETCTIFKKITTFSKLLVKLYLLVALSNPNGF